MGGWECLLVEASLFLTGAAIGIVRTGDQILYILL